MAKRFSEISEQHQLFIKEQKIFFVGTAAEDGRVNISPKGMDTLRILEENKLVWLNLTGSGNETAAHLLENGRMTMMFCSFSGKPLILRLYGHAKAYHPGDEEWQQYITLFSDIAGARQFIEMNVDLVQSFCGMAVPNYEYLGDRDELKLWAEKKGEEGVRQYWQEKNQLSLDGKPTNII
jgi:hypothetical protein